jgi:cytosine/adenosine deaminase-related metal-dependent hydrolase
MISVMSASEWSLTARWIFPVDAPPLERGVVTIAGDRIASVERHGTRAADYDLENAAILPGFVNAHTHLDLSGLRGKCLPPDSEHFTDWLGEVIAHRRSRSEHEVLKDVETGIAECIWMGTTLVGDISAKGTSWTALEAAPVRSIVFYELLGLSRQRAQQALEVGYPWLNAHPPTDTGRPALSPHAPYSVHTWLMNEAAKLTGIYGIPLAIHLAETSQELELLAHKRGAFVPFLQDLGVWEEAGLADSFEAVIRFCMGAGPLLFIHGSYLPPETKMHAYSSIVYCPRTHAAFGHPPHPFREFLARGVRVALGTDSLASNPDLDVLAEARFVHARHPDVAGDVLLRMVTISGAEALGWADETGSLTPGKSADLVVLPLPNEDARDSHNLVFESTLPVRGVLFRGQWTRAPTQRG